MSKVENPFAVMTNADVYVRGGNVVITNVHHGTSEGWMIVVPPNLPVEVRDHYYDDNAQRVVVETTSYESLREAVEAVGRSQA